jgi:hypothetical protein
VSVTVRFFVCKLLVHAGAVAVGPGCELSA